MDDEAHGRAEWQIWYQDTFDRDVSRQVAMTGCGLVAGLSELWLRRLSEGIGEDGRDSFSHFNLWWTQERKSITAVGKREGLARLRGWLLQVGAEGNGRSPGEPDPELLLNLATAHSRLLLAGQTSEELVALAAICAGRQEFVDRLQGGQMPA